MLLDTPLAVLLPIPLIPECVAVAPFLFSCTIVLFIHSFIQHSIHPFPCLIFYSLFTPAPFHCHCKRSILATPAYFCFCFSFLPSFPCTFRRAISPTPFIAQITQKKTMRQCNHLRHSSPCSHGPVQIIRNSLSTILFVWNNAVFLSISAAKTRNEKMGKMKDCAPPRMWSLLSCRVPFDVSLVFTCKNEARVPFFLSCEQFHFFLGWSGFLLLSLAWKLVFAGLFVPWGGVD